MLGNEEQQISDLVSRCWAMSMGVLPDSLVVDPVLGLGGGGRNESSGTKTRL